MAEKAIARAESESLEGNTRVDIDPMIEKKIIRKLDTYLIFPLWFLFLVSFVDRYNIGNAKIQGMETELKLTGNRYNMAFMAFTISHIAFGAPAAVLFRRFGPRSLGVMMFCWSIIVIGQGVTKSYGGLVACRFLLGVFEAGFVPGCAYLIGSYYKSNEFLKRYMVFQTAAPIANAFNGFFSALVGKMHGVGGYDGWRWIFILEGLISIVVSVIVFFFVYPFPEHCTIFHGKEKAILLQRLADDGANKTIDNLQWWHSFRDWKIWVMIIAYIGAEENLASISGFQPTVLRGLGYTATAAQVHSIPIFLVSVVMMVLLAFIAERSRLRYPATIFSCLLSIIGLAIQIAEVRHPNLRYMALFFFAAGASSLLPILTVWLAINVDKGYKRSIALGSIISLGNIGALVASNVFITKESPRYRTGFSVGLGFMAMAMVATTVMFCGLRTLNLSKEKASREGHGEAGGVLGGPREAEDLGTEHPDFRFHY